MATIIATALNNTSSQSTIKLSIITLSFHRADSLLEKLEALKNCDLDKTLFEIVIGFNDGDKHLKDKIDTLTLPYHIQCLMFPENIGISKGRNACIQEAQGDTIYFSDDDCIPAKNTLRLHFENQEKRQAVYIGAIHFVDGDTKTSWQPRQVNYGNTNGANTSIPKQAIDTINGFDENLEGYGGEDILLGYQLKQLGLDFLALPEASTTHIGPDPALAKNTDKAFSAGYNALVISKKLPSSVAFRLGVHPLLLGFKQFIFNPLITIVFKNSATILYEKAYLDGALAARRSQTFQRQKS